MEFEENSIVPPDFKPLEEVLQAMVSSSRGLIENTATKYKRRARRGNRLKVYDNGYIFTYDKDSQCGQRSFWRCERKSECPARVHTNPLTNQIIKRINEHTHHPPNRSELPPWLLLNEPDPSLNDDQPSQTGVLLPHYPHHSNAAMNALLEEKLLERSLSCSLSPTVPFPVRANSEDVIEVESPACEFQPKVSEEVAPEKSEELSLERNEDHTPEKNDQVTVEKNKNVAQEKTEQVTSEKNEQPADLPDIFWEVFGVTKKVMSWMKQNIPANNNCTKSGSSVESSSPLNEFCSSSTSCSPSSSSSFLTVYMTRNRDNNDEPVYQMLTLTEKTLKELKTLAEKRGLFTSSEVNTICVKGPADISVELSEDIIRTWPQESIFELHINRGVCKITKVVK